MIVMTLSRGTYSDKICKSTKVFFKGFYNGAEIKRGIAVPYIETPRALKSLHLSVSYLYNKFANTKYYIITTIFLLKS